MPNPNFDDFITTTLKNYRAQLADNITNHAVFWKFMREKKRFRTEAGGTSIVEPLLYAENSTVKSYSRYDNLDITPQTGLTAAEFSWKQIAGSLSIDGFSEFINQAGKTRILSLLESKMLQLEISYRERLNNMIINGDGSGNGGKDITGLALAIEDGQVWSTFGGIDRSAAANAFWRNRWVEWGFTTMNETNFGTGGNAAGIKKMRRIINLTMRGNERPHVLLTDLSTYETYENALAINQTWNMPTKTLDGGFESLTFRGIPLMWDEDSPAGALRAINFDYLQLVVGKGRDMITLPFVRPADQEAKVSSLIFYAQLTASNCKRFGVITPTNAGGGE